MVILPDGFVNEELTILRSRAINAIETLFSIEPFITYREYFSVYIIEIPSEEYNKQISNANISLRVNAGYLPIAEALKSFIDYDKVAIITRHSIRGEDYSASGPLTDLGKTVAENIGKHLKAEFGEKSIALYSTDTVRTRDTASLINKGWNWSN